MGSSSTSHHADIDEEIKKLVIVRSIVFDDEEP